MSYKNTATTTKPKRPIVLNAQDICTLTARLAQVLAEEMDLLNDMKIQDVEKLQEEKLFLLDALESYKKIVKRQPELSETIPSQDKRDLQDVVHVFEDILQQNHRKLQMAKEVNEQVVKAIRDVVTEKSQTPYYGNRGIVGTTGFESSSVTLNESV